MGLSRPAQRPVVPAGLLRLTHHARAATLEALRAGARAALAPRGACVRYVELHCKTNFSFLEGASHPNELVVEAARLGYSGMAVTDRNSLAGAVRAHLAAKDVGLKLVIGAEVTSSDAGPVLLWAMNRDGYGRLCQLLTRGRRQAPKGESRLSFAEIAEHSRGLLAGVLPPRDGDLPWELSRWREVFPDRTYAVAELHRGLCDARRLDEWQRAASAARVPLIAAGDVHYHDASRRYLQDVLSAIRLKTTVAELGKARFPNAERRLRTLEEIVPLYAAVPAAVARTAEVADRCTFSLEELRYEYPEELCPAGETPSSYLARLAWAGAQERYPAGVPTKVSQLIERELAIIDELNYAAYFLTVWDLVRFARAGEILCQGADRRPTRPSVIAWVSRPSIRIGSMSCSSDSFPRIAPKPRTSTSISSISDAKR